MPIKLFEFNTTLGSHIYSEEDLPCLPLAISPGAVCGLAAGRACKAPMTQTCSAGPDPAESQSTAAGEMSDRVGQEHSGTDGWCLGCAGCPARSQQPIRNANIYLTMTNEASVV